MLLSAKACNKHCVQYDPYLWARSNQPYTHAHWEVEPRLTLTASVGEEIWGLLHIKKVCACIYFFLSMKIIFSFQNKKDPNLQIHSS